MIWLHHRHLRSARDAWLHLSLVLPHLLHLNHLGLLAHSRNRVHGLINHHRRVRLLVAHGHATVGLLGLHGLGLVATYHSHLAHMRLMLHPHLLLLESHSLLHHLLHVSLLVYVVPSHCLTLVAWVHHCLHSVLHQSLISLIGHHILVLRLHSEGVLVLLEH